MLRADGAYLSEIEGGTLPLAAVLKVGTRERLSFARIEEVLDLPNLIEVQQWSYRWFLEEGLRETFADVSPIQDFTNVDEEDR